MSYYSLHCFSKDFDKMKPIIITIDSSVQSAPIASYLSLHAQVDLKDLRVDQMLPVRCYLCKRMFSHITKALKKANPNNDQFMSKLSFCHPCCALDLRGPSLTMEGYSRYMEVPQDVKVRVGADVVVKCSASSSEEPSYFWQKEVRAPQL